MRPRNAVTMLAVEVSKAKELIQQRDWGHHLQIRPSLNSFISYSIWIGFSVLFFFTESTWNDKHGSEVLMYELYLLYSLQELKGIPTSKYQNILVLNSEFTELLNLLNTEFTEFSYSLLLPREIGTIIILFLQRRKLEQKSFRNLLNIISSKWQSWDSNLACWNLNPSMLPS